MQASIGATGHLRRCRLRNPVGFHSLSYLSPNQPTHTSKRRSSSHAHDSSLIPPLPRLRPQIRQLPTLPNHAHKVLRLALRGHALGIDEAILEAAAQLLLLADGGREPLVQGGRREVAQGGVLLGLLGAPLALERAQRQQPRLRGRARRLDLRLQRLQLRRQRHVHVQQVLQLRARCRHRRVRGVR